MARKFQIKRGNENEIELLAEGELGFTLDTNELFIGTGIDNVKYTKYEEHRTHKEDDQRHLTAERIAYWNEGTETAKKAWEKAQEALRLALSNEIKIKALELAVYSNITEHPFAYQLAAIDGVKVVKGVWNEAKQRVEC